jgi:hypothetical protein
MKRIHCHDFIVTLMQLESKATGRAEGTWRGKAKWDAESASGSARVAVVRSRCVIQKHALIVVGKDVESLGRVDL